MAKKNIIDLSESYITQLLENELSPNFRYHNLGHTLLVRDISLELAEKAGMNGEDVEILHLAALFHDIGYIKDNEDHESASKELAAAFLQDQNYPREKLDRVLNAIEATRMSVKPSTPLEEILCDADLANLGLDIFPKRLEDLRYEWAKVLDYRYNELEWLEKNIQFLNGHFYHTDEAKERFEEQKASNVKALKKARKKLKKKVRKSTGSSLLNNSKPAQMMFKTSLRNHIDLTNIADNKANIMLSINALIITIAMPLLAANMKENPFLLIPVSILLATCVLSIIFATLATRPIKTTGTTDLNRIPTGQTNLFFFGNFYRMNLPEYKEGLKEVMGQEEILDDTIMADLYFLGRSLGSKFNQLRVCYSVFMVGITLSVIAFAITFLVTG